MKKFCILTICFMLLKPVMAQKDMQVSVKEVIEDMSKGTHTGFEMMIPEQTYKSIKNDLGKYLRKGSKSRTEEAHGELFIRGAVVKNITHLPLNIYVKSREVTDGVILTAWFTVDDETFYSETAHPLEASSIKKYLHDFGTGMHYKAVNEIKISQERQLKKLENELEELRGENQRSEKKMKQAEREIENNKRSLETTTKLLTAKEEELLRQREVVSKLSGTAGEEEKLAKINLKKIESDKRKLEKEQESLNKKNDNNSSAIENEKRSIDRNLKKQNEKQSEIDKQKEKIKTVVKILENIK
ncbi:MAG: hypothetical protein JNL47_07040 [Bacteroidia bacterium]|nr:hypothetical protein [Bacteroidia bacterium]